MFECEYFKEIPVEDSVSALCITPLMDEQRFTQIMKQYDKIYRPSWKYQVGYWYLWNDGSPEILETVERFIWTYFDICEEHECNIVLSTID